MSYRHPTPLEIRISSRLQPVAKWLDKRLEKRFEGRVHFVLMINVRDNDTVHSDPQDWPIGSYVSTCDRETSALMMLELLAKWEANDDLPPLHELTDANGRSLDEILGRGTH